MAEVVVEGSGAKYTQRIVAGGRHRLAADEPESNGGADQGPSPFELLLSALGACMSITVRMYADRKKIPLEGVTIRLTHGKVPAAECPDCETKEGTIDRIEHEVTLKGDLTPEQRARLTEIASRCPVHRTLEGEIQFVSRLAGS